ncbi:MAG TPA: 50S ribosomal protein L18 [Dehalococcoidia bacterium]|nr:50S ribosomal protein L18 [Dehalococcoidia bacterium]
MKSSETARAARLRRHARVRKTLSGSSDRPRLAVFRSLDHIYAQVIDDSKGATLVAASDLEKEFKARGNKTAAAAAVGELIGKRAVDKGVKKVIFDRGGFQYHGRVKALADGARKAGLEF